MVVEYDFLLELFLLIRLSLDLGQFGSVVFAFLLDLLELFLIQRLTEVFLIVIKLTHLFHLVQLLLSILLGFFLIVKLPGHHFALLVVVVENALVLSASVIDQVKL